MKRESNGIRAVTIQDIADQLNITKNTVSLALRNDPRVNKNTVQRVLAVATKLGYDPAHNMAARRLSMQRTNNRMINQVIGCIFPDTMRCAYYTNLLLGMQNAISRTQYAMVLTYFNVLDDQTENFHLPSIFFRGEVDAIIIVPARRNFTDIVTRFRQSPGFGDRPIISVLDQIPGCPAILPNDFYGAYAATRHLLDLGHRHLMQMVISSPYEGGLEQRLTGVRQAMLDYDLSPDDHLHLFTIASSWVNPSHWLKRDPSGAAYRERERSTEFRLLTYLDEHPEVTAIMGRNDISAIFASLVLQDSGRAIPGDISIIGYDDTDAMLNNYGENELTSVGVPLEDIANQAVQLALGMVNGTATEAVNQILPTKLVSRASTAPATVHSTRVK